MEDCIFCEILEGTIPSVTLYEDEKCIVMMDKFPATKGQCLVIPKKHYNYILDTDKDLYSHIFLVARRIVKAIDKSLNTVRTCFIVEGFAVPHVHIRLHPCYEEKLITTGGNEKTRKELEFVRDQIKKFL